MFEKGQAEFTFFSPEWHEEVSSTNTLLKERVASGGVLSGTVLAARRQTRGRGRMGGDWLSSREGDLTFSFYIRRRLPPAVMATLPMACALGVCDFLALPPWRIETRCKWPNDVLANEAKICGILAEGGVMSDGSMGLVIGIGVNLRDYPDRDGILGRLTTYMGEYYENIGDAPTLLPLLLEKLAGRIREWDVAGFSSVRADFESCLWGVGRHVTAKTGRGRVAGTVDGIGPNGELLLHGTHGETFVVSSVSALEEDG